MLGKVQATISSPKHSLLSRIKSISNIQIGSICDDICSNDDYDSLQTTDTLCSTFSFPSFKEVKIEQEILQDKRSLKNLCKNIKEKDSAIEKLNLKIKELSDQNYFLKAIVKNKQKSVNSNTNIISNSLLSQFKIRELELNLKQAQTQLQQQSQKFQHEINLLYCSLNSRLKTKEIECYNTQKLLREQIQKSKQLLLTNQSLKQQKKRFDQSISYLFRQKEKIKQQRDKVEQRNRKAEIGILRLKYCEDQLKYLNHQYFYSKDIIQKVTADVMALKDINDDLINQISILTPGNLERHQLLQKIIFLEKEVKQLKKSQKKNIQKDQNKIKVNQQLLKQTNVKLFKQQLKHLDQAFSNKFFY